MQDIELYLYLNTYIDIIKMNILCINVQTNGLPKRRDSSYINISDYDDCRIVSIAWIIYDIKNKRIITKYSSLVKPINFTIDNKSPATLMNDVTMEKALKNGILLEIILQELYKDLLKTKTIIAHNFDFTSLYI